MLTGESIPVVKLPLKSSSDLYHPESISSRASTLYGGTVILQTRSGGAQGVQVRVKIFLGIFEISKFVEKLETLTEAAGRKLGEILRILVSN